MDAEQAAEFTQLNVDEATNRIEQADAEELEEIMRVEQAAKDRKTVKTAIEDELHRRRVEKDLSQAEHMLDEVASIFSDLEELEHLNPDSDNLTEKQLVEFVTGTVEEAEKMLDKHQFSADELGELLRAEKAGKDRKTLNVLLHERIREAEEIEEFEGAERKLREIEEAIKQVESETDGDDTPQSQRIDTRDSTNEQQDKEEGENGNQAHEQDEDEENKEQEQKDGQAQQSEQQAAERDDQGVEDDDKEKGAQEDADADPEDEFDRENAIQELGDSFDEDMLRKASDSDLQNLLEQERHRKELVDQLSSSFDRERLEKATVDDLEKLQADTESTNTEDREENQKDKDEVKQEAEDDRQMLMGAGEEESSEGSDSNKVEELRENIHNRFEDLTSPPSSDSSDTKNRSDKALELLDSYRDLGDGEAAVKTAHVMKGYLEHAFSIQREMTYGELADRLENEEQVPQHLVEFFHDMNERQYTGKLEGLNVEQAIDSSVETIKEMS